MSDNPKLRVTMNDDLGAYAEASLGFDFQEKIRFVYFGQ